MSGYFELREPTRITVGAIGPVGGRVFVLQAREGARLVTVKLEKQHVEAISRHLGQLLQDLPRPGDVAEADLELEPFQEPDFVVGTLALAYDASADRIVIFTEEAVAADVEGDSARFSCTRGQAAALATRGVRLVEAGRPACPLCGYPLDPRGHVCPRTNGHHAPLT
ncbi:MAG TPA: DUF3090 domain-containing protein [Acidimicrobiales bacterium]|nr:DUF3090 domain-containing protein [Acidimicrobiales bacterium]